VLNTLPFEKLVGALRPKPHAARSARRKTA
jgi:hypothetical protein